MPWLGLFFSHMAFFFFSLCDDSNTQRSLVDVKRLLRVCECVCVCFFAARWCSLVHWSIYIWTTRCVRVLEVRSTLRSLDELCFGGTNLVESFVSRPCTRCKVWCCHHYLLLILDECQVWRGTKEYIQHTLGHSPSQLVFCSQWCCVCVGFILGAKSWRCVKSSGFACMDVQAL